jgi:hypothetical protein
MVSGYSSKGGRGELHHGAVRLFPRNLHPLHVAVEGEEVEEEAGLTQLLNVERSI